MNKKLSTPFAILIIISFAGFVGSMTLIWSNYFIDENSTIIPSIHKKIPKNNNASNLIGGDRDEHGCIKHLGTWEESCASLNNQATNDWKTYKNEKMGFLIQYPEGYTIKSNIDSITIYDKRRESNKLEDTFIGGAIDIGITNKSLENYISDLNSLDPPYSRVISTDNYTIDNIDGTRFIWNSAEGINTIYIYIVKNKQNYIFSYSEGDKNVQNNILSTFKFTN